METIINKQVIDFKLPAYKDGEFIDLSNDDIKGKWTVFFFYPADFTFVCPTELLDMADNYDRFRQLGVEVISVSTDTQFTHKAWADASESIRQIKFPMLADKTGMLSESFGVLNKREFDIRHR